MRVGELSFRVLGDGPVSLVFLHGLLGQGRNFTYVANQLTDLATCYLFDLPNHGRSPWTDRVDYNAQSEFVAEQLERMSLASPTVVLGHSMGGKVAMQLALRYPQLPDGLIVVDTSPLALGMQISTQGRFPAIFAALRSLPLDELTSRKHADALLAKHVKSDVVRAFLLQNLRRTGDTWRWQPNIELLAENLYDIGDWTSPRGATWDGPTLLIAGANSDFVPAEALPTMRQLFPKTQLVTLTGAGHWVHSEQPEAFVKTVRIALTTILR